MNTRDHEPLEPEERALAQRLARLDAHAGPSAALDAKILAAAAEGVHPAAAAPVQRRRTRPRWPMGLGIAASLAVAVGVAWQLRPQPGTEVLSMPAESAEPALRAVAAPDADTGRSEAAPAAEAARPLGAGIAPGGAEPAGPQSGAAPANTAPEAVAVGVPEPDVGARGAIATRAGAGLPPGPPPPAPELPDLAPTARDAEAAPIVFDEVAAPVLAPPAPPPAPPAPPASATPTAQAKATTPVFVPSPPPADASRAVRAREDAARREQRQLAVPTAAAPALQGAGARPEVEQIVVTGTRVERDATQVDAMADQPYDDQPPASADSPLVRERWLQRVRELRDAGQRLEARDSLREFMRRHPDAVIPDDLRPLLDE